jgi:hypothetical protein
MKTRNQLITDMEKIATRDEYDNGDFRYMIQALPDRELLEWAKAFDMDIYSYSNLIGLVIE